MVKFNVSVLNHSKYVYLNVIFNKTATKLVTILTKCFFPYLNPASYLNFKTRSGHCKVCRSKETLKFRLK